MDKRRFEKKNDDKNYKRPQLGEMNDFVVARRTDIGYILIEPRDYDKDKNYDDLYFGKDNVNHIKEYFLHNNETNHRELKIGDKVNAFLYLDKQKRLAATLIKPLIDTKRGALCDVVGINEAGCYVNIGISKDILFSSDEYNNDTMPILKEGIKTKLPCKLRVRGNNLFIKLLSKNDMINYNDGTTLSKGEEVIAYVYRITDEGINLVDEHFNVIFIHKSNIRKNYHLGEEVKCVIIGSTDEDYYGSTIITKDAFTLDDATVILNYLKDHHGVMNYSSKTDPDIIRRVFNMSKLSFKKALGNLYKQRLVILEDDRTILVRK